MAVLAGIPWFEILLVIPPAIALGYDPLLVGVAAFLGNLLPIYAIVAFHERVTAWWAARRGDDEADEGGRAGRARRIWAGYGLPGLALAGPILTGVHLATVLALLLGGSRRRVAGWMTASLAAWTVALVVASVAGLSALGLG